MLLIKLLALACIAASRSTGGCPDTVSWGSDASTYVLQGRYQPSIVHPAESGWGIIEDAGWLWLVDNWTLGTFTFVKTFPLLEHMRSSVRKVSVWIIADDYYGIRFNGHSIVGKAGSWDSPPVEYDLTAFVRYSSPATPTINKLEVDGTNTSGPGGVTFKVVVSFAPGRCLNSTLQ